MTKATWSINMGLKLCTTGLNRMICLFGIVLLYVDIVFKTPNAEDPASHESGLYGAAFCEYRIAALIRLGHAFESRPQTCL